MSEHTTTVQTRIAEALAGITHWEGVDIDALYDEHFPHEVDRHKFRQACMNARAEAQRATDPEQLQKSDARKLAAQMKAEKDQLAKERAEFEQLKAKFEAQKTANANP